MAASPNTKLVVALAPSALDCCKVTGLTTINATPLLPNGSGHMKAMKTRINVVNWRRGGINGAKGMREGEEEDEGVRLENATMVDV